MFSAISNFVIKAILRSPLHPLLGPRFAVIGVSGLKTGKVYTTPINIAPSNGSYVVVSLRSRTWWRNLRGGRRAQLTTAGKTVAVVGHVIESSPEVVTGFAAYLRQYPGYAKYFRVRLGPEGRPYEADLRMAASNRVLVRLTPVGAGLGRFAAS